MLHNGKECGYVYKQPLIWNSVTWMTSYMKSGTEMILPAQCKHKTKKKYKQVSHMHQKHD